MEPLQGVDFLQLDFLDDAAPQQVRTLAGRRADVVMSDMAAPVTGHRQTDHLRTMALAEAAAWFAFEALKPGGAFCAKVFQGGASNELLLELKKHFKQVIHMKPKSSRKEFRVVELYVIALDFKGLQEPLWRPQKWLFSAIMPQGQYIICPNRLIGDT